MAEVFISYKAEDRARVEPLVAAFEAEGLTIWWDAYIGGGEEWRDAIAAELGVARCVVVVWSRRSIGPEGRFVRDEASRAERRRVYLPVRIDPVEPPLGFGETQALDLVSWKGDRADARWLAAIAAVRAVIAQKQHRSIITARTNAPDRRTIIAGAGTAVLAGLGGWWWLNHGKGGASNGIAVLPFANLSGDPAQVYLCDGIAEELRTALSRIPGLQVIARISSEAVRGMDTVAVSAKLGVAEVLSGSIRRSSSVIRVNAQLVNGATGVERWSDSYDRPAGDSLSIQSEIAERVALALSASLAPGQAALLSRAGTTNTAAHDLLLRARELKVRKDDEANSRQVSALVDAALALDPNYAQAQALKAGLLANNAVFHAADDQARRQGMELALAAVRRAISLDPKLPASYQTLGFILKGKLDWRGALASYRRANALGEDAGALIGYGFFLAEMGYATEAMKPAAQAMRVDPLNPNAYSVEGDVRYFAGDYEAAIVALRRMLAIAPDRFYARYFIGLSLIWLGKLDEALSEFRAMPAGDMFRAAGEAIAGARGGMRTLSDRATALVEQNGAKVLLASIRAQRGEIDEAFALLDGAYAARSPDISALRADRLFDPIRSDQRFKTLVAKLGFP